MGNGIDTTDTAIGPQTSSPSQYFANLPTKECAFEIWSRIEEYYNEMRRSGRLALYRNSYSNYYMGWIYRASMYRSGEQGELTRSFWNHERNLLQHLKVLTTENKIDYKAQVLNSSSSSAGLIEFANGLASHYTQDPQYDLDTKGKQSVEDTLVFGDSSIVGLWDQHKGNPVAQDPTTGQILRDGDMDYFNVTPMDHIINTSLQDRNLVQWRVIRRWVNKYDWAAKYPQLAPIIETYNDSEMTYATKLVSLIHHDVESIPIFYFFHEKSPAVPQGRMLMMADPNCIFEDEPLDKGEGQRGYDKIPVYDNVVSTLSGSPFGYSVAFDLIPLQQTLNELVSAVTTNNINFATQCVMAAKGANLHYQDLATGMSFIEYDPKIGKDGKPEPLNLLSSSKETYDYMQMVIAQMETLAGISAMQRSQTDKNVTSGQYAALITTQSVIFNSGLQKGYVRLMENLMTGTLKTIKKNMIGKKVAKIVGTTSEPYLKEFTSSELSDIDSISVQLINPMLQTPAGKMSMADSLMNSGLIKDAKQYIGVYTEGDLPQLYRRQETQLKLIKQENEAIMKGQCPEAAVTDDHVAHILEHTQCFDTIEARLTPNNPAFVAGMQHVQLHINMLTGGIDPRNGNVMGQINPILAGIIGDPTLPPGMPSQIQMPPPMTVPPAGPPNQPGPRQPQSKPGMPSQPTQKLPTPPLEAVQ